MNRAVRKELSQLQPGQLGDFYAVLSERVRRTTKDGRPFYSLKFRDRRRVVATPLWEDTELFSSCDTEWKVGQHFKIRGTFKDHPKFGAQIELVNIRLATDEDRFDGYDPDQFVVKTRFDVNDLWEQLIGYANSISDSSLRRLVLNVLTENETAIKDHPAATRNHHAYHGGYLEHVVSVVENGVFFAEKYARLYPDLEPPLNRDLIVSGCILHDIGKLRELEWEADEPAYTIEGNLIGHILIGRDMVRAAGEPLKDLNPELLLYLEHIIASHQGIPEWGSPKEPMLPEALLVHMADDTDAKMNMFARILDSHEGEAAFTDSNNILRRKLLKSRYV